MERGIYKRILHCGLVIASLVIVSAIPVEEELRISPKELAALQQYKQIILPRLKHDYMKTDLYLIRFLRAANLNLKDAEQRMIDNLKFREENNLEGILSEDWSDIENDYPYSTDTVDKEGRPIVSFSLGDWDLRKGIVQGKRDRVIRYLDKAFEDVALQIREKQARGENVTQAIFLINLANFNLAQQGCFQCLPTIYQYFLHQVHFPNLSDKIILVNTPGLFETVLQLLQPIMAPETRVALRVFGPDKDKWRNYLYSLVDKNQLYTEFGGTRRHPY
ncbi:phosphatidylinositol/phosphatidylcholine transfer protein SFH2 [Folsomia candida]|uniref:phosphatidylinositol/phosphatidylcholine transfer protein SFH2 n=1 Tax=Folsomia candida TaxID=158441 RepID=UPI000B904209|nr:phosphatidylinositol/phosphatidylcholine transfer protein SFH2 [Folsomia candida]XP_021964969.1 phosphatidylinositol/phosphatidylcholine transfer protein SFH2 [Folsomia candida]XP_021964975.1 phosphatidylinositol/phosphatidylcholine transfer protein SFH2 [Folsomia candida]